MTKSGFDIDELERLLAAATPGEWVTEFDLFDAGDHATAVCLPGKTGEIGTFLAYCQHNWNEADYSERRISWKEATANAALIVAARNYLPAILTEIRELRAENARLKDALVAEREDNLWNCFETGHVNGDQWTHCFMSDGEWLAKECGFNPKQGHYNADEIRSAIPIAARAALGEPQ